MGFGPTSDLEITGINNTGQVAGHWKGDGFVWDQLHGIRWLPKLTNETRASCRPQGINDSGYIVGGATSAQGNAHAVWWDLEGDIHDLGVYGYNWTDSYGINNRGQIVGAANLNGISHLLLWDGVGNLRDLGIPAGLVGVKPEVITETCQIVGYIGTALNRNRYAFVWDVDNAFQLFLGTGGDSCAYDMNDRGQIVGSCTSAGFIWQHGQVGYLGSLTENLNGGTIMSANGINNRGLICAVGRLRSNPDVKSFLLHPILGVAVDIRPGGSKPAPIDLKSHGKLPVGIYGSPEFNVLEILPETVTLAQTPARSWKVTDLDGDEIEDLLLHFSTQSLQIDANTQQVRLDGRTTHGQYIRGFDYIKVVGQ
jgi:probable HAF family extracellular repeat protein